MNKGERLKVRERACCNVSAAECSHTAVLACTGVCGEVVLCGTSWLRAYPQLQETGDLRVDWRGMRGGEG